MTMFNTLHSYITNGLSRSLCLLIIASFVGIPLAQAQFQSVSAAPTGAALGQAFQQASINTTEDIGNDLTDDIEDGLGSVGGSGNPIFDGVAEGASAALSGFIGCKIGGFIAGATGAIGAANGLTVPVSDSAVAKTTGANEAKECTLDALAFGMKEGMIRGLIAGMTEYVNTGFNGGPQYVTNEEAFFEKQQEDLFKEYLANPGNFSTVCSAWEADVRLSLATQYSTSVGGRRATQLSGVGTGTNQPLSSGSQVCPLDNGGYATGQTDDDYWGTFLAQTTTTQGNPLTAYFDIEQRFMASLEKEVDKTLRELEQGDGFFNATYCDDGSAQYNEIVGQAQRDSSSATSYVGSNGKNCYVTTPGSVINAQLNTALSSDVRRFELADEINELIGAITNTLISKAFSNLGLLGTSQRNGSSKSVLEEYGDYRNPAIVQGSRQVLVESLGTYYEGISGYIAVKQDAIAHLFTARQAALDTYACYESKHNTWTLNSDYSIVPADRLGDYREADRSRASFVSNQTVTNPATGAVETLNYFLGADQSEQKTTEYRALLEEINSYILQTQSEIETAQFNRDEARVLAAQLGVIEKSSDPIDAALADSGVLKLIAEKFAEVDTSNLTVVTLALSDGTTVDIPQELSEQQLLEVFAIASEELVQFDTLAATNQRRLVEIAVTDMVQGAQLVNGGPRQGGLASERAYCGNFTEIYVPPAPTADS